MTDKTILVTGGAGHVGSHLIELLVANPKNRVISLDNYFNGSRDNHIPGAEYREGHTKNIAALVPESVDIIYHLGEYARIASSFEDVDKVYDMNMIGTFAVVEYCRTRKVDKLVYAGSSTKFAIEGNGRHQSPYAFTKANNVDLINDYGAWYGVPYAICYFYNGFGPREVSEGKYATVIARFAHSRMSKISRAASRWSASTVGATATRSATRRAIRCWRSPRRSADRSASWMDPLGVRNRGTT